MENVWEVGRSEFEQPDPVVRIRSEPTLWSSVPGTTSSWRRMGLPVASGSGTFP